MPAAYGDEAPIAALATPPGESGLAVVRTSGAGTLDLLAKVFSRPASLGGTGNQVVHGWILRAPEERSGNPEHDRIDEVAISLFRSPKSFTGEDCADISCHGGSAPARGILKALRAVGFRDALRGEFSFRAFMNGKLDLTRAESIMELVAAKTDKSRERAVGRLSGLLEREIRDIKTSLTQVLARTELFLDYPEDEFDEGTTEALDKPLAEAALEKLLRLGAAYLKERLYQEGALAVLAGRPNAGKSSLFNLMLGEERSIVTDIPGTTRDWIESWISLGGIPLRLADTAGLRESEAPVESLGIERSRELLSRADLVLYLVDGEAGLTREDEEFLTQRERPDQGLIVLWNKGDLAAASEAPHSASLKMQGPEGGESSLSEPQFLRISAKTGMGIPELNARITSILERGRGAGEGDSLGPGTPRQKELIDRAIRSTKEALALYDRGEPLDIIAPFIREGVDALGEITGEVSTDEILEAMFSQFCVGK